MALTVEVLLYLVVTVILAIKQHRNKDFWFNNTFLQLIKHTLSQVQKLEKMFCTTK